MVGGDWGLGCNAIHFLDLLTFFTRKVDFELDISHLDSEIRVSKKERFVEFTGFLLGKCRKATKSPNSTFESQAHHTISLYNKIMLADIDTKSIMILQSTL